MTNRNKLYLIGSLRNGRVPVLANRLRETLPEVEVFDDWFAAGFEADDWWKTYEVNRGRSYKEALRGYAARHVFEFDKHHLDTSSHCLLVLPAGKSGHIELAYAQYATKAKTAILLDPDNVRFDVMYKFIPDILEDVSDVESWLESTEPKKKLWTPVDVGHESGTNVTQNVDGKLPQNINRSIPKQLSLF